MTNTPAGSVEPHSPPLPVVDAFDAALALIRTLASDVVRLQDENQKMRDRLQGCGHLLELANDDLHRYAVRLHVAADTWVDRKAKDAVRYEANRVHSLRDHISEELAAVYAFGARAGRPIRVRYVRRGCAGGCSNTKVAFGMCDSVGSDGWPRDIALPSAAESEASR